MAFDYPFAVLNNRLTESGKGRRKVEGVGVRMWAPFDSLSLRERVRVRGNRPMPSRG
jgi:hypothetical protein